MAEDVDHSARFAQDFLTALRCGRAFHGLSVSDIVKRAHVARGSYYAILAQQQFPRWPNAIALAAATGWRMDLVIAPLSRCPAQTMSAPTRRGHLPPEPVVATAVLHCVPTMRDHVAAALLIGLAERGWSLRQAARAAHLSPTKPTSLLTAEHGPDISTLAQFMRPMGYAVTVRYRPWDAPDPPVLIQPTQAAAQLVRSRHASTLAPLTRLLPALGNLIQVPDDDAIRATFARLGTVRATAAALQVAKSWLRPVMKRLDIPVRSYPQGTPATRRIRNSQIVEDATSGQTYRQIGLRYGITGSRVQQILRKQGIDLRKLALRRQQVQRDCSTS